MSTKSNNDVNIINTGGERSITVDRVVVTPKKLTIAKGEYYDGLKAKFYSGDQEVQVEKMWYADCPSIVAVYQPPIIIQGGNCGKTKIWAYPANPNGTGDYCEVTVVDRVLVEEIRLEKTNLNLNIGDSYTLNVDVSPNNAKNKKVRFCSDNISVAKVDSTSGIVKAVGLGNTTIYACSTDGSKVAAECFVEVKEKDTEIKISPSIISLKVNDEKTLQITNLSGTTNSSLEWKSSSNSIAEVDNGKVKGNAEGVAQIYVMDKNSNNIVSNTITVFVSNESGIPREDKSVPKVPESTFADPVDVYTGAHLLENTIMQLFDGIKMNLKLQYNSSKLSNGIFGKGWYHNFEKRIENYSDHIRVYSNPSSYDIYVQDSEISTKYNCQSPGKHHYYLTVSTEREFYYNVFYGKDSIEYYNLNGQLAVLRYHDYHRIEFSYTDTLITVKDLKCGKSIYLEKDSDGKVKKVYDDNNREAKIEYYNDLISSITGVDGNSISYTYNTEGRVLTGTDANGDCYFTNTYDGSGRVQTQKDGIANHRESIFEYDDENHTRITTDRNLCRWVRTYDENGLLLSISDEDGNTKSYEYDNRYNVIKEIDEKGNFITKEYNDLNKVTKIIDKMGYITEYEYDDNGNLTRILYPAINGVRAQENFVYNWQNLLIQHTDKRGTVTTYEYSNDDRQVLLTKKVGNKPTQIYEYDGCLLMQEFDAEGYYKRYGYDTVGRKNLDCSYNEIGYVYNSNDDLTGICYSDGNVIKNTYDGNHQLTQSKDGYNRITKYEYNENMKLVKTTFPDNTFISHEYDGEDRIIKTIDKAGNETTFEYDIRGRMISKTFPDLTKEFYQYDQVGNIIKETARNGGETVKTYDANGNLLTVTDAVGNVTSFEYDAMGRVVKTTNSKSGSTEFTYSVAGDLLSETDALGNTKTYTYDAYGNRLTATDAKGNITTYTYDNLDRLLTVTDALNNTTTYTYSYRDKPRMITDANGNTTTYTFDTMGRYYGKTDALGNETFTVYDYYGNVKEKMDTVGMIMSSATYNYMNLPTSITDVAGQTTTYTYNHFDKVATETNPLNLTKQYSYNDFGENTKVTDYLGNDSTAQYDLLGNVTKITGPLGMVTNYTYDILGRLISETTPSGEEITYTYNNRNLLETKTNARGQTHTYSYDALGRVTSCVTPEGTITYTYDANGNMLTVTDSKGTITRQYDELNRVISYTDTAGKTVGYEYDAVGNITKITYPDNTAVTYTYNANNKLATVTDWANRVTTYTYDSNNDLVGICNANGTTTTYTFDIGHRLVSKVDKKSDGTLISGFEYTYDDLGRFVREKNLATNKTLCYTYDELSRVTKCETKNSNDVVISTENFTYDAAGNIISAPNRIYQYDSNNKMTTYLGDTIGYDEDGNIADIQFDGMPLESFDPPVIFDSFNRLLEANGNLYQYDAENNRIRSQNNYFTFTYVHDTNCKLSRMLVQYMGSMAKKYVYGLGLIGEEDEGEFYTNHYDYRGSTVAITDESQDVVLTTEYDVYGSTKNLNSQRMFLLGYCAKYGVITDPHGFCYMRSRYYCPERRRFLNPDVLHGNITDSTSLNRYAYVNGNPVSLVDPMGLAAERGGNAERSFLDYFKNADGSYSLYDNLRRNPDSVFHEQILSYKGEGASFDLQKGDFTLGELNLTAMNGGWEWKYVDLSLLDVGNLKLSGGLSDYGFDLSAMASIYSPEIVLKLGKLNITITAEIGSVGASMIIDPINGKYSFKGAFGMGFGISASIK